MDIKELTLESIKNYYKVLTKMGTIGDDQLYKLLLVVFIDDLFQEDFSWFITEDNYAMLTEIVNCISRSTCIVPNNIRPIHTYPISNYLEDTPTRISEDSIIRLAESDVIKLANL